MASDIGPGDYLECVQAGSSGRISLGSVYRCAEVRDMGRKCALHRTTGERCDGVAVRLFEVPPMPGRRSGQSGGGFFCSHCFRPIYRPKADLIESLKQPAPAKDLVDG